MIRFRRIAPRTLLSPSNITPDGSGMAPKVIGEKVVERKDHATISGLWLSSSKLKVISNDPPLKSHSSKELGSLPGSSTEDSGTSKLRERTLCIKGGTLPDPSGSAARNKNDREHYPKSRKRNLC